MKLVNHLTPPLVRSLHALYQGEWWSRGRTPDETRGVLRGSDLVFGFAEKSQLLAFARVLTDFTFKALIFDVIVDPAARGRGLGQRLVDAIVSDRRLARVGHVELYCRPELVKFYAKWGFRKAPKQLCFMRLKRRGGMTRANVSSAGRAGTTREILNSSKGRARLPAIPGHRED